MHTAAGAHFIHLEGFVSIILDESHRFALYLFQITCKQFLKFFCPLPFHDPFCCIKQPLYFLRKDEIGKLALIGISKFLSQSQKYFQKKVTPSPT
jgi:hypothetical protein